MLVAADCLIPMPSCEASRSISEVRQMKTRSQKARYAPSPQPDLAQLRGSLQPAPGTSAAKVSRAAAHLFHRSALLLPSARHSNLTQFMLCCFFLFLLSAKRWRPSLLTDVNSSICLTFDVGSCGKYDLNSLFNCSEMRTNEPN